MKNLVYSMVAAGMLLFSQGVSAQITLEHTFDGYVMSSGRHFSPVIDYYTPAGVSGDQVKLYNEDYSLYKSITITPPADYSAISVSGFSKNLVTTDDKITFFVVFRNTSAIDKNLYHIVRLYDENGIIVKDFGGTGTTYSTFFHEISNGKCRLLVLKIVNNAYKAEVYSIPGTVTELRSARVEKTSSFPYPNPANTVITLPYQLEQGETSVMRIYNINGQLIELKQIDSTFNKILLNVSDYTKGIYFYEVNGVSNKFIVE